MRISKLKSFVSGIERYKKEYGCYPRYAFLSSTHRDGLLKEISNIPEQDKATRRTIKRTQLIQREGVQHHIRFGMGEKDY